ncbi:MAG: 2-oxoisovalerate dehydrogenase [Candidatus Desantisbacteria bacterium]
MSKEIIFLVEESLEGGYEAKALGCPIYTEGETLEELRIAVTDAVKCHFEQHQLPDIIRLHIVKDEVIAA